MTILDCPQCPDRFFEAEHLEQHLDIKHRPPKPVKPVKPVKTVTPANPPSLISPQDLVYLANLHKSVSPQVLAQRVNLQRQELVDPSKPVNPQVLVDVDLSEDDISILEIMDQEITGRTVQPFKDEVKVNLDQIPENNSFSSPDQNSQNSQNEMSDSDEKKPQNVQIEIGRDPRTITTNTETENVSINNIDGEPPVARKRGRPRKNIQTSSDKNISISDKNNSTSDKNISNSQTLKGKRKADYGLKPCSVVLQRINLDKDTVYELKRTNTTISGQVNSTSGQSNIAGKQRPVQSTEKVSQSNSSLIIGSSRSETQEIKEKLIETNNEIVKNKVGSPKRPRIEPATSIILNNNSRKSTSSNNILADPQNPGNATVSNSECRRSSVRLVPLARLLMNANSIAKEPNINVNPIDSEIILSPIKSFHNSNQVNLQPNSNQVNLQPNSNQLNIQSNSNQTSIKMFQSFVHPNNIVKESNPNQIGLQLTPNNSNGDSVSKRLRLDSLTREATVKLTPLTPDQVKALLSKPVTHSLIPTNARMTPVNTANTSMTRDDTKIIPFLTSLTAAKTSSTPVNASMTPVAATRKPANPRSKQPPLNTKPINSFFKPIEPVQTGSKQVQSGSKPTSKSDSLQTNETSSSLNAAKPVQSSSKPDHSGSKPVQSSPEPAKTKVHSDFKSLLSSLSQKVKEVDTRIKCGACSKMFRDYDQLIVHVQKIHQSSPNVSSSQTNSTKSKGNNNKLTGLHSSRKETVSKSPKKIGTKSPKKNVTKSTSNNNKLSDPHNSGNSAVSKKKEREREEEQEDKQKKYLCLVCDQTFYTRDHLERHTLKKHNNKSIGTTHNPGKVIKKIGTTHKTGKGKGLDIKCSICSKEFDSNILLATHYNAIHKRK